MCDNLRAGVTRAHRYEPDVNATYEEMAAHYGVAIIPTRTGQAPRQGQGRSRRAARRALDPGPAPQPAVLLPGRGERRDRRVRGGHQRAAVPQDAGVAASLVRGARAAGDAAAAGVAYEFARWRVGLKVNIDYHVESNRHYYSVPYQLVGTRVDVRTTATTVEVFHAGAPGGVAPAATTHPDGTRTDPAHMPESHRRHAEWSPSRIIVAWAEQDAGRPPPRWPRRSSTSRPHPEQGYRSCLGIIRLADRYGTERVEAACARALAVRALSYRSVESILRHGLDSQPLRAGTGPHPPPAPQPARRRLLPVKGTDMLTNATLDGLHALRLPRHGPRPDRTTRARRLRSARLRGTPRHARRPRAHRAPQPQLERALKTAKLRFPATVEGVDFRRHRGLERAQVLALADSHWVDAHHSVVIVGATGLGKTYLACALANAAIRRRPQRRLPASTQAHSTKSPSPEPTAASHACSPAGLASTSCSSTTS